MDEVWLWTRLADAVLACPAEHRDALTDALVRLGAPEETRTEIASQLPGARDDSSLLRLVPEGGVTGAVLDHAVAPGWSDDEVDRAITAAAALRVDPDDPRVGLDALVALPPDDAGRLVAALHSVGADQVLDRVVGTVSPLRFPVGDLVRAAVAAPHPGLVRAVALTPHPLLLTGLLSALGDPGVDKAGLAVVIAEVAELRRTLAAGGAHQWWPDHRLLGAPTGAVAPGETTAVGDTSLEDDGTVWRGGEEGAGRKAFPRVDVETGTARPDVVVIDRDFVVTVGLRDRRDAALVASAPVTFATGETVALDVVLLHDPASVEVAGSPLASLTVSDATPFPTHAFTCTARYGEDLGPRRRLGLQVVREGQVIAVAWRTVVAVDSEQLVAAAVVPASREATLLDLDALVGMEAPDLVVSVCRGDGPTSWVWTAFSPAPGPTVTDRPSTTTLEGDVAGFALETRRSIAFSADPAKDYLGLAGRARRIGRAVPPGVQDALRAVMTTPDRTRAPAVLLLTEELVVPWELACLEPPLATVWGGDSPFLGAHAAIARWPLTEHTPRPRPPTSVTVRSGAVLTADYTGVPGWGRLDAAVAEATTVAGLFDPPATAVSPDLWTVMDLLRGLPAPADVLHLALHGQYDAAGDQEGIVLLAKSSTTGAPTAQFLTPAEIENGALDHAPLVFLNACQVGTDERVLGDYAGFASTLLRIGAAAVVAPLWNVRDDVASSVARSFYAATLTSPDPVPVAEAVRALRATYTEEAVRAGAPDLHATLVAYQVFGHPRLRLRHPGPGPHE